MHTSIKFDWKILQSRFPFLDTEVYIKNNKVHTKIYRKKQIDKDFAYQFRAPYTIKKQHTV